MRCHMHNSLVEDPLCGVPTWAVTQTCGAAEAGSGGAESGWAT